MAYPIDPSDAAYAPFVGYFDPAGPQDSVIAVDDLYLSAEGPTLRHYKNDARDEFWDEVLYATQDPTLIDATAPLGGVGAQYPA